MPKTSTPPASNASIAKSIYLLLKKGEADKANQICAQALQQAPADADLLDARGMILGGSQKLDEAETAFRAALKSDPRHLNALNNLGNLLRGKSEFGEAAALYRSVIEHMPDSVAAHCNLGKALIGLENIKEANQSLRRALSLNPAYSPAIIELAQLMQKTGDTDTALALLEKAISNDTDNIDLRNCSARMHEQTEQWQTALTHLEHIRDLSPKDYKNWLRIGNLLSEKNKFDEAEEAFVEAARLAPGHSNVQNSLGILYNNREQTDKALVHYRKALEIDPQNAEAHNNLGNVLVELGDKEKAAHHFAEALRLRPGFEEVHINRIQALDLSPGDPELEKLKGLLRSENLDNFTKTNLLFVLAKVHDRIGLYDQAFAYAKKGNGILAAQTQHKQLRHRQAIDAVISTYPDPIAATTHAPENSSNQTAVPIFIVGMSRSGKTLTESILAKHPDVYAGGERKILQQAIKSVSDELGIKIPFPHFVPKVSDEQLKLIGKRYMEAIKDEAAGARYFIDTMPSNFPYVGLIFQAFTDVRVITCQRHLLDNCLYAYFQRYKTQNAYSYDLQDCAAYYADYHKMIGHWQRIFGNRIYSQTYEDLVGDTGATAQNLFKYCDLKLNPDWLPGDLDTGQIGRWHHYTNQLALLIAWLEKSAGETAPVQT